MKTLPLLLLLASPLATADDIATPAQLKASPDIVIADEMGECAGLIKAAAERKKDAQPENAAVLANLENGVIGYTAVSLFYIRSHFSKNHIDDDPDEWVRSKVNRSRISALMFLEDASIQKELRRCDTVDFPLASATVEKLRHTK